MTETAATPSHRDTLPRALTALIGREEAAAEVTALLLRPEVPLVTLTGPGGVGKTRLAVRVGGLIRDGNQFPDGVWFVDLSVLRDPGLVLPAVGRALGVRDDGGAPPEDSLREFLRPRELLVILDNVEQVVAAAPRFADLLRACPGLTLLATSRAPLRISSESLYPVPPLALPETDPPPPNQPRPPVFDDEDADPEAPPPEPQPPPDPADAPAVALFLARAASAQPGFALTPANAPATVAICRALDGLPLALELAAARLSILSPDALLARLTRRLDLLTHGPRDLPARHQTLRDAIAWSYDLLTAKQQALFRRLAVFPGGFTLESAEAVAGDWGSGGVGADGMRPAPPDPPSSVLDLLSDLVDQSLVQVCDPPLDGVGAGADPDTRFAFLETIRAFAGERLDAAGETAAARNAHLAHVLALAEERDAALRGPEQGRWMRRLDAEVDNLRAALAWALDPASTAPADAALRLSASAWMFLSWSGRLREGRDWLRRALDSGPETASVPRARALLYLANVASDLDELREARAHYEASLALWRALDDRRGISSALMGLGIVARSLGDLDAAKPLLDESLTIKRQEGDDDGIAHALYHRGRLAEIEGNNAEAQPFYHEALLRWSALTNESGIAYATLALGQVARRNRRFEEAEDLIDRSLTMLRRVGDRLGVSDAACQLGRVAQAAGNDQIAANRFREAIALAMDTEDWDTLVDCIEGMASIAVRNGHHERAIRLAGVAATWRETTGHVLSAPDRADLEQTLATARGHTSATLATKAWAAGRAMPLAEAAALAATVGNGHERRAKPLRIGRGRSAPNLTRRERDVLRLIAVGLGDRDIAERLFISRRTASSHVEHIFLKLGVNNRQLAAVYAVRNGLA